MAGKLSRQGSTIEVRHVAEVLAGMTDHPAIGQEKSGQTSSGQKISGTGAAS